MMVMEVMQRKKDRKVSFHNQLRLRSCLKLARVAKIWQELPNRCKLTWVSTRWRSWWVSTRYLAVSNHPITAIIIDNLISLFILQIIWLKKALEKIRKTTHFESARTGFVKVPKCEIDKVKKLKMCRHSNYWDMTNTLTYQVGLLWLLNIDSDMGPDSIALLCWYCLVCKSFIIWIWICMTVLMMMLSTMKKKIMMTTTMMLTMMMMIILRIHKPSTGQWWSWWQWWSDDIDDHDDSDDHDDNDDHNNNDGHNNDDDDNCFLQLSNFLQLNWGQSFAVIRMGVEDDSSGLNHDNVDDGHDNSMMILMTMMVMMVMMTTCWPHFSLCILDTFLQQRDFNQF